jgi:Outer membrane protein beta-barrel domain
MKHSTFFSCFKINDAIRINDIKFPANKNIFFNSNYKLTIMKNLCLPIVILLLSLSATAQTGVGVKGGLNSYALTSNVDDKSFISAPHFGVFAQINITEYFSVQPELMFSSQGNGYETNGVKESRNLNYINIPVMLQANTKKGFTFEAGPEFGFLMSAKYKAAGSSSEDIKKDFKSTNLSFGLGIVYRMKIGLGFGFRYNIGLTNISAVNNIVEKSTGGQLGVSYKFSGKKKSVE